MPPSADGGGRGSSDGGLDLSPDDHVWLGSDKAAPVDNAGTFGANMSGLSYQPAVGGTPAVLWAVQNGPSKIWRLLWNGTVWAPDTANGWRSGKALHYPGGSGSPDSEGITKAMLDDAFLYVSSERDNDVGDKSRPGVLRFDTSGAAAELVATNEWNLTTDLPAVDPNLGLEAIAFVPDGVLTEAGFVDDATHAAYEPARYPNHGTGLFFVGLEANGVIYGYALDHAANTFKRIATFASGQPAIMDLAFDRDTGNLWGYCDNTCGNKATILRIDAGASSATKGRFQIGHVFDKPAGLPNANFEGIAFAPLAECVNGSRSFFWIDDDATAHVLWRGTLACALF